jgi:uncharacterized protein YgiB involved in biofilm formation
MNAVDIMWGLVVALVVIVVGIVMYVSIKGNDSLTVSYNTSVTKCVAAGGQPLVCKDALLPR